MSEELKPCSFCGCKVELVTGIYGLYGAPDHYTIAHPENDCIMSEFACYCTDDKEYLIEDWNKRAIECVRE